MHCAFRASPFSLHPWSRCRKKSIKAAASPVDTSWLDDYTPSPSPSPTPSSAADLRPSKPSTPASSPPASPAPPLPPPPLPVGHTVVVRDAAPLVANHNEAEAVSIQEDVDQGVELLVPRSSRDEAGAGGGSGSDSSSSDVNGVEGGDGGLMAEDVEVTVDGGPTVSGCHHCCQHQLCGSGSWHHCICVFDCRDAELFFSSTGISVVISGFGC